ncbi:Golgi apparatus protein 1-like isoform X3 [Strongylocentrotus purpuratus]|uniref:Golgi apparatus protein 1 n=1 Tax=Strongylocentrotus purpuratus TaxID=7668 RepID=A0A7M7N5E4_STRPU|nr:Golgi apparatus protein 1-like isoform X3 [Strongylocentrotus purpuratus]
MLFAYRISDMCKVTKAMQYNYKDFNTEMMKSFLQHSQTVMDEQKFCGEMTAAPPQGQTSITLSLSETYYMSQAAGVQVARPLPLDPSTCSLLWKSMDCDQRELNSICQVYAFLATIEGPILESQKVTLDTPGDLQPNEPQSPAEDNASDQSKTASNPGEQGKGVEETPDAELQRPSGEDAQPKNPAEVPINGNPLVRNPENPAEFPINGNPLVGNPENPAEVPINGNPLVGNPGNQAEVPVNEVPVVKLGNQAEVPVNEIPVGNPGNQAEVPVNEIPVGNPGNQAEVPINETPVENPGNQAEVPVNEIPVENPGIQAEVPVNEIPVGNPGNQAEVPINETPVGNPGNQAEVPINEVPVGNPGNQAEVPVNEIPVGNPGNQAEVPINETPVGNPGNQAEVPINEVPVGNRGNPAEVPVNEVPVVNPGNQAEVPINETPVGNPGNQAEVPINEVPVGNRGNPAEVPVNEIPVGNPGNQAEVPVNETPVENPRNQAEVPINEVPVMNPVEVPINENPVVNPGNPAGSPINENPDVNLGNPAEGPINEIPAVNPGNPAAYWNREEDASEQPQAQVPDKAYRIPIKSKAVPLKPVRIADHPACIADVQHICPRNMEKGNNFAVLDCLQMADSDISADCNHFLWNYKKNLTTDYRFDNAAAEVCREDLAKLQDCSGLDKGKGLVLPCLLDHVEDISIDQCTQYLNRMKQIIFSDYRLITGFYQSCNDDIDKFKCDVINEDGVPSLNKPQPPHSQGGTIHCLEKNIQSLDKACKLQILRVAELSSNDYHEDRSLFFACKEDRERFCAYLHAGQGNIYKCLKEHKFSPEMSTDCKEKLTTRQKVVALDYKVNFRLQRRCKKEIQNARCQETAAKTKEVKLAEILICLGSAGRAGHKISGECQAELTDTRKEIMSDYMINPGLVKACSSEIDVQCKGLRREGKTIHCLMALAKKGGISAECKKGLSTLMEEAGAGSDYRIDPALRNACKESRALLCPKEDDAETLSCLMDNIEDNQMMDNCAEKLLEIQYFISRNFRLDPLLFKNCESDAGTFCYEEQWQEKEETPSGLVFSCLHRHLHDHSQPLQSRCADQVHRVLRQRAVSVYLNPRIEENCRVDLGAHCNDKTKRGEELRCLQDHLDDLGQKCRQAVGNFTVEEAEDVQMNRKLIAACAPMLRKFCQDKLKAKRVDEGEALKCLIEHKNDDEMEAKCQASIEHFQLIQLKDYRFTFKFKESCHKDVLKLCKGSRDKPSIINCLTLAVRDSVLQQKEPPVDPECRSQLKFELLQRNENIKFDPELTKACGEEVTKLCPTVTQGNARVMECLWSHQEELGNDCHVKVFNREKEMAAKPDIDYALMHSCKKTIKTKCKDVDPDKLIDCLKEHKDDPGTGPRCRMVLNKRQIERNSNIMLNPLLRKACKMDIPKFCKDVENEMKSNPTDMEGKIIGCLRGQFSKRQPTLSPACDKHMGGLLKEGAEDYRLDRNLVKYCSHTIKEKCSEEMDNPGTGRVEECLKAHLSEIKDEKCQQQLVNLFLEGLADIHVDPLLYKACALDIKHYCAGIPQGQGQQISCVLEALDEEAVHLQPDCKRMMLERREMWEYAARLVPALSFRFFPVFAGQSRTLGHPASFNFHYFCLFFLFFLICLYFLKKKSDLKH